jgi:hypothetical protein
MDENCASRADYTTILLGIGPPAGTNLQAISRPVHFNATQGVTYTAETSGDVPCGATGQTVVFTDGGKTWKASLLFGRDAPAEQRAEAYRILDSLQT